MNLTTDLPCETDLYDFPASFGQEQLWYLHEMVPESTAYNIAFAFELRGELDHAALEQAFASLIQRHDALRTGFAVVDEQLRQIVSASADFRLMTEDLSGLPEEARERELDSMKRECARHRFALSESPLLYVRLARASADRHVLLMCVHHIVVDHLSVLQLGTELERLYAAARAGDHDGSTQDDRLQFPDYVVWQRERMSDEVIAQKLEHWHSTLGARPPTLDLPTDRPRPASQSFRGDELAVCLPRELSSTLRQHAQQEKQSLFVLMLAALNLVLHKYSGQRELMVGCPMANRPAEELNEVVGLFMNVLPVRVEIDPEAVFHQLSQQVRRQLGSTLAHQDTPFERIVRAGDIANRASRNPLVQVWFTFQDAPMELALQGLEVKSEALHNGGSKLDLSLWFWDDGTCIRGLIEYSTDLFDRDTVQRFSRHLMQVLHQATQAPGLPVGEFSLLTPDDHQAIQTRREAALRPEVMPSLHGAFFERAAARPQRLALTSAAGELTAGDLAARADAMGNALKELGVQPGDIVGICLERGESLLPALLGVLRCGAAYLPLDPALPAERIAYMLGDSGARVAIAEAGTRDALPSSGVAIMATDVESPGTHNAFVPHVPDTEDLAYVIYTSGSTGRPKGVRITHGAAGNFLSAMAERPGISEDDVLLALTIYAFDISVLELFLPLAAGARVHLLDRTTVADGNALGQVIDAASITMVQATPSTWRLLRTAGWLGKPGMKALVGGEALQPELARWLLPKVGELWNMYGPTETTVWSSCARIDEGNVGQCPIGTPVANTILHVVDENLHLLPPGIAGELVIGGRGLSQGYLNREELTCERFLPLPETGERVYRTGDRAIWRKGQLHHLGRDDDQVKVRGFRIELGEIESVLAMVPGVEFAAVKAWNIDDDDQRIVAYYCTCSGADLPAGALREHAGSFLPTYMLPQHFVHLDCIPLLPNGKVDRGALPLPVDRNQRDGVAATEVDLSPGERMLLEVCRELIGSDALGIGDNFFDAGGHSLLALTLVSRIEARTGVRLPILKIARSSLRALAEDLDQEPGSRPPEAPGLGTRLHRWVRSAVVSRRGDVFP